jgi:F-type H+-transporting ATPase subunit delta
VAAGSGARRYAEALLDIATEESAVDAYRASLDKFAEGLDPENIRGLRDQRVPSERRRAALDAATQGEPKAMRAVLAILLERDRIEIVPDIARAFAELVDRREGVAIAKITTAVEVGALNRVELVRRLEQASGKKVRATFEVDPALIGGARVQVGDRLIDASLYAQLESLAKQLSGSS